MFKFRSGNLQGSQNTRSRRSRCWLFGSVKTHILALFTATFLFMGVAVIHAQQLFVGSGSSNEVLRYNGATGAFIDAFVTQMSGGLALPEGLVFGPDGNLYVSSEFTNEVLRYNGATGAFIDAFVTAMSGGLNFPIGLVFGLDGNLYVSSGTDEILRYDGTTGIFIDAFVTAGSGGLEGPTFLVFSEPSIMEGKGGGCSVASAGAPVSVSLYLLVPVLFVIIRRVLKALRGQENS